MIRYTYITLVVCFFFISCQKDKPEVACTPIDPCDDSYKNYATKEFDYVFEREQRSCPLGTFDEPLLSYGVQTPVFNPLNSNEIIYSRANIFDPPFGRKLWKLNFCTGSHELINENYFYGLDWSPKGWLLFTGVGTDAYKVKENGDSLTLLSDLPGFNNVNNWNPSGTMFCLSRDSGDKIYNEANELVYEVPLSGYATLNWLYDDILLGVLEGKLYSLSILNSELTLMHDKYSSSSRMHINEERTNIYKGTLNWFLKYPLDGSNRVDTIRQLSPNYLYGNMDVKDNKMVAVLSRAHWKDSIGCVLSFRADLLIYDLETDEEWLIELPE